LGQSQRFNGSINLGDISGTMETAQEKAALANQLYQLESEHRDLDEVIGRLSDDKPFDQLKLQRLKKRKLILKDEITKLKAGILPDIIA
jgi:hypothetical protein